MLILRKRVALLSLGVAIFCALWLTEAVLAEQAAMPKHSTATEANIRMGFKRNAALSQLHRQWTYYENSNIDISVLLDTLADDVTITTPAGKTEGIAAFKKFVTSSTPNYSNGHTIISADVADDGSLSMQASANYVAAAEDGNVKVNAQVLNYSANLSFDNSQALPKFSEINIALGSTSQAEPLQNAYAANRLRSLIHYYNSLVENPARDAEPFRELFVSEFNIDFGTGEAMQSFEQFEKWIAGPASSVSASTHIIDNFSFEEVGNAQYKVLVDFSWKGILPNGLGLAGKTNHEWLVVDDSNERFARIKDIKVSFIEPIGPVKN